MTVTSARREVVVIAALCEETRLIGRDLGMPWPPIREDLKRFKRLTLGHVLIVGRCTFTSIIRQFGAPLPQRRMLVLTTSGPLRDHPDIETCASLGDAIEAASQDSPVFVAGGHRPYKEALDFADRLELTIVEGGGYEGDTYFPPYKHLIGAEYRLENEEVAPGCRFMTYRRCKAPRP